MELENGEKSIFREKIPVVRTGQKEIDGTAADACIINGRSIWGNM